MSRKRDPLYFVWYNMFRNCRSNKYYQGVSVCDEWRSRAAFEAWAAAHDWRSGLMLARRDKTADFSPENCVLMPIAEANGLRRCVRRLPDGRSARDICGRAASRRAVQRTAFRLFAGGWDVVSAREAPPLYKGAAPIPRMRRKRRPAA